MNHTKRVKRTNQKKPPEQRANDTSDRGLSAEKSTGTNTKKRKSDATEESPTQLPKTKRVKKDDSTSAGEPSQQQLTTIKRSQGNFSGTSSAPLQIPEKRGQELLESLSIENHVYFLQKWKAKKLDNEIGGFAQYNAGLEFIQWRSNPPFYLDDQLNKTRQKEFEALYSLRKKKPQQGENLEPFYIRGINHPLWALSTNKKTKSKRQNRVTKKVEFEPENTLFPNTFTGQFSTNNPVSKAENTRDEHKTTSESGEKAGRIYDQQLRYKTSCLQYISTQFNRDFITVSAYNDYPCLMVHTDVDKILQNLSLEKLRYTPTSTDPFAETPQERLEKGFTLFVMSFYTGLVNRLADQYGLDIFLAERRSFGYSTPSIAETISSFRINLGLMPPSYAKVHIEALNLLNQTLQEVFKRENKIVRDPEKDKIENYDEYKDKKGVQKGELLENDRSDDWRKFAFSIVEAGGKEGCAIFNVTRIQTNLDYVNITAFNAVENGQTYTNEKVVEAFKKALVDVLKSQKIEKSKNDDKLTSGKDEFKNARYRNRGNNKKTTENNENKKDKSFEFLENEFNKTIVFYYESLYEFQENFEKHINGIDAEKLQKLNQYFSALIEDLKHRRKRLEDLYDLINDYLVIYASLRLIKEWNKEESKEYDYGSDSEAEEDSAEEDDDKENQDNSESLLPQGSKDKEQEQKKQTKVLKIKKIITHNGMRALLVSIRAVAEITQNNSNNGKKKRKVDSNKIKIDVKNTYYELKKALSHQSYKKIVEIVDTETEESKPTILARDANAIVIDGQKPNSSVLEELRTSESKIWIIDTTSSTQTQMQKLAEEFRKNQHAELLCLVSSGFKNEQGGADKNSYGTVRVIADKNKEELLNEVLTKIKKIDQPIVEIAHEYRRLLKELGFVPRDNKIIEKPTEDNDNRGGADDEDDAPNTGGDDNGEDDDMDMNNDGNDEDDDGSDEMDVDDDEDDDSSRDSQPTPKLTLNGGNNSNTTLQIFQTTGDGNCGIHAMFGTYQNGVYRNNTVSQYREKLADFLGKDKYQQKYSSKYQPLFMDLLLEIYHRETLDSLNVDQKILMANFDQIKDLSTDMVKLRETNTSELTNLNQRKQAIINTLHRELTQEKETSQELSQFLVGEILKSEAESDRMLKGLLSNKNNSEQLNELRKQDANNLKRLIQENLNDLISKTTNEQLKAEYRDYLTQRQQLDRIYAPLVQKYYIQLMQAYSKSVKVDGFYLRDVDLEVLADIENKQLKIYRQSDQDKNQYILYSSTGNHQGEQIEIYHQGVHYERAKQS